MIQTNNGLNVHHVNVLDTDMYIIVLLNFQNHQKLTRKNESKSIPMRGVIVHRKDNPRRVIMTTIKIYMHLWYECLLMTKFLEDVSLKVHN